MPRYSRDQNDLDPFRHKRKKHLRLPRWTVPALIIVLILGAVIVYFLQGPTIGTRNIERKMLAVVLPPPPPPPPPPKEKPPEPPKPIQETKAEVTPPTPTPPTPQANDALSAREGPAAGNFGLAVGNGGGTRIGGGTGGDAFMAYVSIVQREVRTAMQSDPKLKDATFAVKVTVKVNADGAIQDVSFDGDDGTSEREQAIKKLLSALTLSQKPPSGLPPVRLALSSRSSF